MVPRDGEHTMNQMQANIRQVLANAEHPVASLMLSGSKVEVGFDESDADPVVYMCFPDLDPDRKIFMTGCETGLFIAAIVACHCQITGKDHE